MAWSGVVLSAYQARTRPEYRRPTSGARPAPRIAYCSSPQCAAGIRPFPARLPRPKDFPLGAALAQLPALLDRVQKTGLVFRRRALQFAQKRPVDLLDIDLPGVTPTRERDKGQGARLRSRALPMKETAN
jgi:hypothetical protein